jgi:hypothetical protein
VPNYSVTNTVQIAVMNSGDLTISVRAMLADASTSDVNDDNDLTSHWSQKYREIQVNEYCSNLFK